MRRGVTGLVGPVLSALTRASRHHRIDNSAPRRPLPMTVSVDRPGVFAICDMFGSAANHARFMLMFLMRLERVAGNLPK